MRGGGKRKNKNSSTKLGVRLGYIITRLLCGEKLRVEELSQEFGVTKRTIREDLNVRLRDLYITCKDGFYFLDATPSIKNYELLNFSKKSGTLGLYPNLEPKILSNDSLFVNGFNYENIDKHIFGILENSVANSTSLKFDYNNKNRLVKPYKLINLNGIWYLAGVEDENIKNFHVAKISNLKTKEKFNKDQKYINLFKNNQTFISQNLITIKLKADKSISEFLQRRDVFPNQKILQILDNGDILLETKASFEPDILGIISYWIPHISVIEPLYLKEKLLKNLEIYLEKEK